MTKFFKCIWQNRLGVFSRDDSRGKPYTHSSSNLSNSSKKFRCLDHSLQWLYTGYISSGPQKWWLFFDLPWRSSPLSRRRTRRNPQTCSSRQRLGSSRGPSSTSPGCPSLEVMTGRIQTPCKLVLLEPYLKFKECSLYNSDFICQTSHNNSWLQTEFKELTHKVIYVKILYLQLRDLLQSS